MIIITTSSSISVKPRCARRRQLPVMVMHPVQPLALGDQLRERHCGGGHESHDRQRDDELNESEAARAHGLQCCAAAWIAIFSGGAELLPTAAPAPPSTFIMAMMLVAGRAVSALNCSTIRLPLPCTGSSEVVVTSSCAPLPRVSTLGLPAAAGTMSPGQIGRAHV